MFLAPIVTTKRYVHNNLSALILLTKELLEGFLQRKRLRAELGTQFEEKKISSM